MFFNLVLLFVLLSEWLWYDDGKKMSKGGTKNDETRYLIEIIMFVNTIEKTEVFYC